MIKLGVIDNNDYTEILYEENPSDDYEGYILELKTEDELNKAIEDIENENIRRINIQQKNKIDELTKIIEDLQTIPKPQRVVLDTYLIKLISNSSLFTNEEKESLGLIIEDFEVSTEKELELNNIEEIKENVDASDWKANTNYIIGDYVKYNDNLYKVIQSHFSLANWTPDTVPAIFLLLAKKEEIEVIEKEYPQWKQPLGSHDSYKKGDGVTFNGKKYESLVDNNAHSPTAWPAGWKLVGDA